MNRQSFRASRGMGENEFRQGITSNNLLKRQILRASRGRDGGGGELDPDEDQESGPVQ